MVVAQGPQPPPGIAPKLANVMFTSGAFLLTDGLVYFFFIRNVPSAAGHAGKGNLHQTMVVAAGPPIPGAVLAKVMLTSGGFFLTVGLVYFFFIRDDPLSKKILSAGLKEPRGQDRNPAPAVMVNG